MLPFLWLLIRAKTHTERCAWSLLTVAALAAASGCAHRDAFLGQSSELLPPGSEERNPHGLPDADRVIISSSAARGFPPPVMQAAGEFPADQAAVVRTLSHSAAEGGAQGEIRPVAYPVMPRMVAPYGGPACPCGAGCPHGVCPVLVHGPGVVSWDPTHYPDEYLCDGGDRGRPFHYEGRELGGLETEDTIADAYDEQGRRLTVPSSKVCVYAPRFGALRTITGVHVDQKSEKAAGAYEGSRLAGVNTHLGITEETQRDRLQQFDTQSRPSGVNAEAVGSGLHQLVIPFADQSLAAVHQNLAFVADGLFRQANQPILEYGVQCAGVWSRDQYPILAAHDAKGAEVEVEFNVHEYVGTEDRRKPGDLRIVKLADRETARPGDVITFTLRFDNLGQRDLYGVRIIDNLTPRLEFIEGSVKSARAGSLDVQPNGEGSSILTFLLDDALAGESGDAITFQCRVK